ncbi:cysteine desulfurase-like protein [Vallicoccus soli]|uniref:Cysteine desulfurase-like protein n=1 Tax=Vallicoccus soli TaxID=2339232 RepID=A0A3A3ZHS3_9ACTN|nr:cysteine desulfurase-like protein [Vallicoccus soli]RJK94910.1 cysteine desulfurase-like protein [Vallicoccus soli]
MSQAPTLDVRAVRAQFPALAEGTAHFDAPGGTQVPFAVVDAVAASLRSAVSNRGGPFPSSARAEQAVADARSAVADLVGGLPDGVVLGQSMTALTYVLAGALAKRWGPGDEVVVTRLDHDANVRPWVQAAERAGAAVRWLDVDPASCLLGDHTAVLSERTRLVAVTGASNVVGTRPDVRAVTDAAHEVGALAYVDGVHLTPHVPVDVAALGADFYALSLYKLSGPHLGAVVADPALLEGLHPDKLLPSSDAVPARFEHGTPPFELHAGVVAAVEHLAGLVPGGGARRERLLRSMAAVQAHEEALLDRLVAGLEGVEGVTTYGAALLRTPTVALRVAGRSPREVAEALAARGVAVGDGDFYARELVRALGLHGDGGVVRAGVVHYTSGDDVDRLLAGVAALAA